MLWFDEAVIMNICTQAIPSQEPTNDLKHPNDDNEMNWQACEDENVHNVQITGLHTTDRLLFFLFLSIDFC